MALFPELSGELFNAFNEQVHRTAGQPIDSLQARTRQHLDQTRAARDLNPLVNTPLAEMTTQTGTATVRSAWIVRTGETAPRLTSCYIL